MFQRLTLTHENQNTRIASFMSSGKYAVWTIFVVLGLALAGCGEKQPDAAHDPGAETNSENGFLNAPAEYLKAANKGQRSAVRTVDTAALNAAIQLFNVEHSRFPKDLDELVALKYVAALPQPPKGMKLNYDAASGTVTIVDQ